MDDGDGYRKLLLTASSTQQQRHTELHNGSGKHVAGNVFLPAIQKRNSTQSALSMKHLEVIEQCILAENRREEQLAKCQSERERRYLAKKFAAQREHERDLLQALMLGRPTDQELHIVDVDTVSPVTSPTSSSPLDRRKKEVVGGVQIVSTSPDKLISMKGEKTFTTTTPSDKNPTKAVSPHFHGIKSPARRREEQAKETALLESKASPTKPPVRLSPTRERPTKSASPSESAPHSPVRKTVPYSQLSHTLSNSPLRQSVRQHEQSSRGAKTKSPSPAKKKKRTVTVTHDLDETIPAADVHIGCDGASAVSFTGATSFHEARQQALAIMQDSAGQVDGGTQTTDRSYGLHGSFNERMRDRDERFVLMLTSDNRNSPSQTGTRRDRPHSSPELRSRRLSAGSPILPALAHSHSGTFVPRTEFFHASADGGFVTTYATDDRSKVIQVLSKEEIPKAIAAQLTRQSDEPSGKHDSRWAETTAEKKSSGDQLADEDYELDWDALDRIANESDSVDWEALEAAARNEDATRAMENDLKTDSHTSNDVISDAEAPSTEATEAEVCTVHFASPDEQESDVILDIVYSIVHQLEDVATLETPPVGAVEERTITIEPKTSEKRPKSAIITYGLFATRIQSAFRGMRARRAFRLALYQQALECGVLGAMPGTQQGYSGWYQDPKSFMAYYFVVRPDGEWVQKAVLRCSALVLTPYAMRAQIFTRVHGVLDTDEDE